MPVSSITLILIGLIVLIAILIYFIPIQLYLNAKSAGLNIELINLIFMKVRKSDPYQIINPAILLKKNGIDANVNELEAQYLSGGSANAIAKAMIIAKENNMEVSFDRLSAIDLAGKDLVACIKECLSEENVKVNPETFTTKNGEKVTVSFTLILIHEKLSNKSLTV